MKNALVQTLKLSFAVGLIVWLIKTEKITSEPFIKMWSTPWLIPFVFIIIFSIIVINNWRWQLLLAGQSIHMHWRQTLPLTFIGLFFNLAMPGSVGGDVIKAYYIAQDHPGTKLRAATSVLMDRVVGLYALGLISLTAVITSWGRINDSHELSVLAVFVTGVVVTFTVCFALGFSSRIRSTIFTENFFNKIPAGKVFHKFYDVLHAYRNGKKQFIWGILLSIGVHIINILTLYTLARILHFENVTLASFFFIIPIGFMATAIPISPAGIGVGQAVFLTLFGWYQLGTAHNLGPTLITIYQMAQASLSLVGAYFYFTRKHLAQESLPT